MYVEEMESRSKEGRARGCYQPRGPFYAQLTWSGWIYHILRYSGKYCIIHFIFIIYFVKK